MRSTPTAAKAKIARSGFTLIEVLTVIVIIGILAALLIPAVNIAVNRAKTAAMRAEVEGLSQAIEAYNAKYGDYPPDFSDWALVQRHYRKVFPNIAQNELLLLLSMCTDNGSIDPNDFNPTRMDRAEALVWSLGGFSSNPEHPFTGTGGPIDFYVPMNMSSLNFFSMPRPRMLCQYNTERDNSLFDFEISKLGLFIDGSSNVNMDNHVMSTDDPDPNLPSQPGDWFPVYRPSEDSEPIVYFDSRTYDRFTSLGYNGYAAHDAREGSFVRPYFSDQVRPKTGTSPYGTVAAALRGWKFANADTFQVIGPGLDGLFGNLADVTIGGTTYPFYMQYPKGFGIVPRESATLPSELVLDEVNGYIESGYAPAIVDNFHLDNVTNFSSGKLEDDVVE